MYKQSTSFIKILAAVGAIFIYSGVFFSNLEIKELTKSTIDLKNFSTLNTNMETLYRKIIDRETGQRGFLLTKDSVLLEPYIQAEKEIPKLLKFLEEKIHESQFKSLNTLIKERKIYYDSTFNLLKSNPYNPKVLSEFIAQGRGKVFTDALRSQLNLIKKSESTIHDEIQTSIQSKIKNIRTRQY